LVQTFAATGDEAAFALIVERHAGMVLSVCQRILHNQHEAEDAAQAAFFVLARKAGQVRWCESIAPWLSSVAYRVALKARSLASAAHEIPRHDEVRFAPPADSELALRELREGIDEEVQRLPEKLRGPVVLCYLEGRTYDQAAQVLGWRTSTLKGRLERARNLLRSRLATRDLLPGMGLPASFLEAQLGPVATPGQLAASISRIAVLIRAGESAAPGILSPTVAAVMTCPVPGITLTKAALLVALILLIGVSTVGGALLGHRQEARDLAGRTGRGQQPANTPLEQSLPKAVPSELPADPSQRAVVAPTRLDRFGDPLPEYAISRLGTTRLRHGDRIRFLRFTPDGKTLVSQAEDGVRTWNVATAAANHFFPKEPGSPTGADIDLSPDGKLLAVPSASGIGIWELGSGRRMRTIGATSYARVCFSPDGALMATIDGGEGTEVSVWSASSGRLIRSWKETQGPISSLLFAGDGQTLITANTAWRPPSGREDNRITLWDPATGKEWRRIDLRGYGPSQIAVSTDGRLLAALCRTNMSARVFVWDAGTGKEIWHLDPGPAPPNQPGRPLELCSLTFFPDGKLLIAGQEDDLLVTWTAEKGLEKRKFTRELALAGVLAVSPDGKTVAAVGMGKAIRLVVWESGKDRFPEITYPYREVAGVTAHGRTVVMRGGHDVSIWDPITGPERRLFERPERTFWQVRLTADERQVQIWEEHPREEGVRAVSLWDLLTGAELQRVQCPEKADGNLYPLALAPDGKLAALFDLESPRGRIQGDVVLLEMSTGKILRTLAGNGPLTGRATFTPDGQRLVLWGPGWRPGEKSSLHVWDMVTGQRLREISFQGPEPSIPGTNPCEPIVSPDGRNVAVAGLNKSLAVYDLSTGALVRSVNELSASPHVLSFSRDGRSLAWGGQRNPIVAIVELATGRERQRFAGHEGQITSLAFSGNGKLLVSHSDDTTALAWDLTGRLAAGPGWGKPLTPAELDAFWEDLANEDAARAWRAMQRLESVPSQAVAFLGRQIVPARTDDVEKPAEGGKTLPLEHLRLSRSVEMLERIDMPEARSLLQSLAGGRAGARLTQEATEALVRCKTLEGLGQK
jgi:RNA polymerase sigma factor (sigma-70 family)